MLQAENRCAIIIPIHNTPEAYLRTCLDSVLRQDYTNWEAWLVDDGSNNGAENICDEYAEKDTRIHVIHQRASGVSAARNAGMDASGGEWLIFLDSDDWWEDKLLSSAMAKLTETAADLLVFGVWVVHPKQRIRWEVDDSPARQEDSRRIQRELQLGILNRNARKHEAYTGAPWMQLIRRRVVEENHLRFDTTLTQCEDALFNLKLLEQVRQVALLNQPLTNYRVFENSAFHRFQENLPEQLELVNQRFKRFLEDNQKGKEYWNAYEIWVMETYVRLIKRHFYHPDNPHTEAEKKAAWKQLLKTCPSLKVLRQANWAKMYHSRKSYPLLMFCLLYVRSYALNCRVVEWLLKTDRY